MTVRHLALVGTTASGKSGLALALAEQEPGIELVSIDSMQVYRGMDIGTAKPSAAEQAAVPHHLIDVAEPGEEYTVARFQRTFRHVLAGIEARGNRAILVGGTGLYLRAVIDDLDLPGQFAAVRDELATVDDTAELYRRLVELDPAAAARIEPSNRRRIVRALEVTVGSGRPFSSYGPGLEAYPATRFDLVGVWLPRAVVAARIEARYREQLDAGFVDEVRLLLEQPGGVSRTAGQALGYRELIEYVEGRSSLEDALDLAVLRTRQFARRQRVWFRRDPRIVWLAHAHDPAALLPLLAEELPRRVPDPQPN